MGETLCPCHSGRLFSLCCESFLNEKSFPETAVQLMRSRYCAYSLAKNEYLITSWHKSTCPQSVEIDKGIQWTRLMIKRVMAGTAIDIEGQVEYVAIFKMNGKAHRLHENSRFLKESNRWLYVDGDILPT